MGDSKIGNGLLTYPVALITADELYFAGSSSGGSIQAPFIWFMKNKNNTANYKEDSIYIDKIYTLTPGVCDTNACYIYIFNRDRGTDGYLNKINSSFALRPVLSLSSNVMWQSGDGSYKKPYKVVEN